MLPTTSLTLLTGFAVLGGLSLGVWFLRRRRSPMAGEVGGEAVARSRVASSIEPGAVDSDNDRLDKDHDAVGSERAAACLHRLYALAFRQPAQVGDTGNPVAGQAEVAARVAAILARIETQARYTPRRPRLLPQLMRASNEPDASLRRIAGVVAQDPALAGNLLRIANSAVYRVQSKPVESVERAVTLVGTDGIRLIIAAALVQPVVAVTPGPLGRFPELMWEQTLLAATAASEHARRVEADDAFAAQLLGLLIGLGSIIVVQVARDEYARTPGLEPDLAVVTDLLDAWSAPTASRVAESWGMSARMAQALDDQHRADVAPGALTPLGRSLRFGRVAGALGVLRRMDAMDEDEAVDALARIEPSPAREPIWERLKPRPTTA